MSCCDRSQCGRPFDPEDEGPSEADLRRFGSDVITCPECGMELYASASKCSNCGAFVGEVGSTGSRRWVVAVALVALIAFVAVFVF